MAAGDWISLYIHPAHLKVLTLARITGEDPHTVTGRAVAWFRWVDDHLDGPESHLDAAMFLSVIGNPRKKAGRQTYVQAMTDPAVGWITLDDDGLILVTDFDKNFGQSSRRRRTDQRRKAHTRGSETCGTTQNQTGPSTSRDDEDWMIP